MSGIAGVLRLDGGACERSDLAGMIETIAHRGPDAVESWAEGPVGMANALLRTTPESAGERLPLVEGDLALAADARIDNRAELLTELELVRSVPDSSVILAAYRKWQDRCAEHLIGDFAFALWDRSRRTLLLARDHLGVRPLVWVRVGPFLAFASQERALFALPEVPCRLNETAVGDFLLATLEDTTQTFYQDVHRLPPHHSMTIGADGAGVQTRSYWELDASRELTLPTDEAYEEAFRAMFLDAVRARTRSIGPVATELSGGLDSSAVTCATRDLRRGWQEPVPSFSIEFEEPGSDERRFVDAVVASGGIRATKLGVEDLRAIRLDEILGTQDGPFASLTVYMESALCTRAAEGGNRVLLGGFDGDVVVSHGLERLPDLLRRGRWGTLGAEVSQLAPRLGLSRWEAFRSYALAPVAPATVHRLWGATRHRSRDGGGGESSIRPEFARRVGSSARGEAQARAAAGARTARGAHLVELASGVLPAALEIRDRVAAAAGVELRHPFFDVRLVELCLSLPDDQKMRKGVTRSIQRRALAGIVPDVVLRRPDKGRINDAVLVGLLRAEQGRLDGGDLGRAGAFLEPSPGSLLGSSDPSDLAARWQSTALARWLDMAFPPVGVTL